MKKQISKTASVTSMGIAVVMLMATSTPASALTHIPTAVESTIVPNGLPINIMAETPNNYAAEDLQTLTTEEHTLETTQAVAIDESLSIDAELSLEYLAQKEAERVAAEKEAERLAEEKRKADEEEARLTQIQTQPSVTYSSNVVAPNEKSQAIVDAAMGQIGVNQDCTMLVTNSLRAVGINFHGWPHEYAALGTITTDPQPGDIAIQADGGAGAGHVAIYIGNGQAVHGGFGGTTKIGGFYGSEPYFVRIA